jgi:hypothetical protein
MRDTLKDQPDIVRKNAVAAVQGLIKAHYRCTDTPILEKNGHPAVGITWRQLISIAMRGDMKGRRQQMAAKHLKPGTVEYETKLKAYEEELDLIIKSGRLHEVDL